MDSIRVLENLRVRDSVQLENRLQELESTVKSQTQNLKRLEKKVGQLSNQVAEDSVRDTRRELLPGNKDVITQELNILSLHALQYYLHSGKQSGGNGYLGFTLPTVLMKSENARYKITKLTADSLMIQATSTVADSWIAYLSLDENGVASITYQGFDK